MSFFPFSHLSSFGVISSKSFRSSSPQKPWFGSKIARLVDLPWLFLIVSIADKAILMLLFDCSFAARFFCLQITFCLSFVSYCCPYERGRHVFLLASSSSINIHSWRLSRSCYFRDLKNLDDSKSGLSTCSLISCHFLPPITVYFSTPALSSVWHSDTSDWAFSMFAFVDWAFLDSFPALFVLSVLELFSPSDEF